MSEEEKLEEQIESDLEVLLGKLLDSEEPDDRAQCLADLASLGASMSQSDLSLSMAALDKAREAETVTKLKSKIDKLLSELWKNKKGLEYDGIEKPMSMGEIKQKVATDKLESYGGPLENEDHLANLRALPVIEDHLYWIALWAKITIALTIIGIIGWFIVFYLLASV